MALVVPAKGVLLRVAAGSSAGVVTVLWLLGLRCFLVSWVVDLAEGAVVCTSIFGEKGLQILDQSTISP